VDHLLTLAQHPFCRLAEDSDMIKANLDVVPDWFYWDKYANLELTPEQWRVQLEARALIRTLLVSPNVAHYMPCPNEHLLKIDADNTTNFASRLVRHIADEPILPSDYFTRAHFNEPMTGSLSDRVVELTGATTDVVRPIRISPYVTPVCLGDAITLAQLSDDAGYSIPEPCFNPPEYQRDVNEMIREFPGRFITGAGSTETRVYATIDLNGPDDLILIQLHNLIRTQRRKFNIYPTSKPQHESIRKLLEYKTLEILDLENWSLLNETKILSSVYRSLFDKDLNARNYREVQKAFAQNAMTPRFLNFLKGL
jgi:hypothetical protein